MVVLFGVLFLVPLIRNTKFRNQLIQKQKESMSEIQMVHLSSLTQEQIDRINIIDILTPECVQLHTEFLDLEEIETYIGFKVSLAISTEQSRKLDKAIREHSTNPLIRDWAQLYRIGILMNAQKISQKYTAA
jgi:hypothetical protein